MNRRQFLRFAGVPVAAAVALPELARTIILPPRGGWPLGAYDIQRYTYQTHALGYAITDEQLVEGYAGQRFIRPAAFKKLLEEGLNRVFTEAYTVGLPDENGVRVPWSDEWEELFRDEPRLLEQV